MQLRDKFTHSRDIKSDAQREPRILYYTGKTLLRALRKFDSLANFFGDASTLKPRSMLWNMRPPLFSRILQISRIICPFAYQAENCATYCYFLHGFYVSFFDLSGLHYASMYLSSDIQIRPDQKLPTDSIARQTCVLADFPSLRLLPRCNDRLNRIAQPQVKSGHERLCALHIQLALWWITPWYDALDWLKADARRTDVTCTFIQSILTTGIPNYLACNLQPPQRSRHRPRVSQRSLRPPQCRTTTFRKSSQSTAANPWHSHFHTK